MGIPGYEVNTMRMDNNNQNNPIDNATCGMSSNVLLDQRDLQSPSKSTDFNKNTNSNSAESASIISPISTEPVNSEVEDAFARRPRILRSPDQVRAPTTPMTKATKNDATEKTATTTKRPRETSGLTPTEATKRVKNTFADVAKRNLDLQVTVTCNPTRMFSEEDKWDFIDAIGDAVWDIPADCEHLPTFESTTHRGSFIVVMATNEASRDWLLKVVPVLNVWKDVELFAQTGRVLPKLEKAVFWFPGKKKLETATILKRLVKQNPCLSTTDWRVFSRHEESHGCRLLIGVDADSIDKLKELDNRPHWASLRAQVTRVCDIKRRTKPRPPVHSQRRDRNQAPPVINKESLYANEKGLDSESEGWEAVRARRRGKEENFNKARKSLNLDTEKPPPTSKAVEKIAEKPADIPATNNDSSLKPESPDLSRKEIPKVLPTSRKKTKVKSRKPSQREPFVRKLDPDKIDIRYFMKPRSSSVPSASSSKTGSSFHQAK